MLTNQRQADPWGLVVSKRPYFKNQGGWFQRNDTRSWPLTPYSDSPTCTYTDTSKQIHKESDSVILRVVLRHELFLFSKQAKQYSRSLHIVSVAFPHGSASMPGVLCFSPVLMLVRCLNDVANIHECFSGTHQYMCTWLFVCTLHTNAWSLNRKGINIFKCWMDAIYFKRKNKSDLWRTISQQHSYFSSIELCWVLQSKLGV